ncbi:glutaredoxin [bacterium]|nr:glutaredoxin [bacterium]
MSATNSVYRKPECPFGKKAIALLNEKAIPFEDHIFKSKEEEELFKAKQAVKTTPQIFFGEERIGGYTDLAKKLGAPLATENKEISYFPVIAIFSTAALLALATSKGIMGLMGYSLSILALQKLMDVRAFVRTFEKYDLLTQATPLYGKVYPVIELALGLSFLAAIAPMATGIVSVIVGLLGAISIFKAVYIDKKDLNCGCVGGNSRVPLGFVSFTENAVMTLMGIYVLFF